MEEVLEKHFESSEDNESYESSSEDLFIVGSSKSVNDSRKDGYSDGATSTSLLVLPAVKHGQVQRKLCSMF